MQRFDLLLKNEKIKSYRRIATFLILINVAVFILFAVNTDSESKRVIFFAGTAALIVLLLMHLFFNALKKNIYQAGALLASAIVWMLSSNWIAAVVCIILLLLYITSVKPVMISVGDDEIRYMAFPSKVVHWNELDNVVLKDGILTIDFANNRLLQASIEDDNNSIKEKEFNEFCSQRLTGKSK